MKNFNNQVKYQCFTSFFKITRALGHPKPEAQWSSRSQDKYEELIFTTVALCDLDVLLPLTYPTIPVLMTYLKIGPSILDLVFIAGSSAPGQFCSQNRTRHPMSRYRPNRAHLPRTRIYQRTSSTIQVSYRYLSFLFYHQDDFQRFENVFTVNNRFVWFYCSEVLSCTVLMLPTAVCTLPS